MTLCEQINMLKGLYRLPVLGFPPSSSSGWAAFQSRALWISGGIGGATGKWAPWGWKPSSFAVYEIWIWAPSGPVYWNDPWASCMGSCEPAFFSWPFSCAEIPLSVSKLQNEKHY